KQEYQFSWYHNESQSYRNQSNEKHNQLKLQRNQPLVSPNHSARPDSNPIPQVTHVQNYQQLLQLPNLHATLSLNKEYSIKGACTPILEKRNEPEELTQLERLLTRLPSSHPQRETISRRYNQVKAGYIGELYVDRVLNEIAFP